MGVYSYGEERCDKLGEHEREISKPINRKWDTEQKYKSQQPTRIAGRQDDSS